MNNAIATKHADFLTRLNTIAWPIKCHWAKHFPIQVLIDDDVGMGGMDFSKVYVHPDLANFDDDTLLCILAHEWAHRMFFPKSALINLISSSLIAPLPQAYLPPMHL